MASTRFDVTSLEGKTAVVTGGAVSIGAGFGHALASAGARVAILDIQDGSQVIRAIEAEGGTGLSVTCDVSAESSVKSAIGQVIEAFGAIDILVNNAAVFAALDLESVADIDVELWDRVMAVNVRGAFLVTKHVVPHMIAAGGGKIVNVSSGVAYKGMARMAHYATSKAALLGLTRSLSRELGEHGICVNSIAPGLIASDSLADRESHVEQFRDRVVASRAIRREGLPEDLIGALLFLSSADSDFVTGQSVVVDGGSVNI